jgi:hypothetical protein
MRGRLLVGLVVLFAVLMGVAQAAVGSDFIYFSTDLGTLPGDQVLAVLAVQGIVNRDSPTLFVNTHTLHPWQAENPKWFRNEWDATWLSIYASRGYTYDTVTSLSALLALPAVQSKLTGLVEYNSTGAGGSAPWIAMTIAGVEDRVPVTPAVVSAVPGISTLFPDNLDLRTGLGGKVSAYTWAIDSYLSLCSKDMAYIVGHDFLRGDPGDIIALDWAVAHRAFIFDLGLDSSTYPGEEALADTIVSNLTPPAALVGWYDQIDYCVYAGQRGDYVLNSVGASNLSFHRRMAAGSADPLQQTSRMDLATLELDPTKYYLAIVFTDGDAPQRMTRFYDGDWLDPARGQVPISWGVSPALVDEFPTLFEFFYANASQYDYFVAGPSGVGYAIPSIMPNAIEYGQLVAEKTATCDVDTALVIDPFLDAAGWDSYLATAELTSAVDLLSGELRYTSGGQPIIPGTFVWTWEGTGAGAAMIASNINAYMRAEPAPGFAAVYDSLPADPTVAKQVMDILAPQGYVFLRLDEMSALLSQIDHFYDVGTKYWAHDEVEACYEAGVVQGYSETHYEPTLPVSRDQMAVYVGRALAGGEDNVPDGPAEATFDDVPDTYWAYAHVEYCYDENVVQGYTSTTYVPTAQVTRDQMAVYVARSLVAPTGEVALDDYVPSDPRNFPDVADTFWAYKHIEYCVENGVVQGYLDGFYHPETVVTRDQMAVYVARAFELPM